MTKHTDQPRVRGETLLSVDDLTVTYTGRNGSMPAVQGVSFEVARGEVLGIVGESGSGKSTVLSALMRMLPRGAQMRSSRLTFDGVELDQISDRRMRTLRGRRIGLVPQRPMTSMSPVTPVRTQLRRLTGGLPGERIEELLVSVGLAGIKGRLDDYPFQFSGGQLQRMLIAVAVLAREPELVLADEPTTTLDATVQEQILRLLLDLKDRLHNAIVFVSHDLGVIAQVCDRVGVMYGGTLVEIATTRDLFEEPRHPYTRALLDAMPGGHVKGERLRAIKGSVSGAQLLPGCPFAPRCERAEAVCHVDRPAPRPVGMSVVRCHFPEGETS